MDFPRMARFFQEHDLYRRLVEEFAFITYREVREFDFTNIERPRPKPAAREP